MSLEMYKVLVAVMVLPVFVGIAFFCCFLVMIKATVLTKTIQVVTDIPEEQRVYTNAKVLRMNTPKRKRIVRLYKRMPGLGFMDISYSDHAGNVYKSTVSSSHEFNRLVRTERRDTVKIYYNVKNPWAAGIAEIETQKSGKPQKSMSKTWLKRMFILTAIAYALFLIYIFTGVKLISW